MDKRILFVSSLNSSVIQFMIRDMAHGFRCLGWDVEVLRERWPGETSMSAIHIAETALWFRPDIIFGCDYMRGQAPELWPLKPVWVSWVQDALPRLLEPQVLRWHQPQDLILHSYAGLGKRFTDVGYPAASVKPLKPGVNLDLFYQDGVPPEEFTVGFIANPAHPGHGDPAARYAFYTEPVRWLMEAGIPVKTWGEGWQNPEFGSTWQGLVRNGPALRRAYSSVHANLHINVDCTLDEHQRPYESLACGRSVIARCAPGANEVWGYCFTDKDTLLQAVAKAKDAWRFPASTAQLSRNSVMGHGYDARAKQVIAMAEGVMGA